MWYIGDMWRFQCHNSIYFVFAFESDQSELNNPTAPLKSRHTLDWIVRGLLKDSAHSAVESSSDLEAV